jgi:hypothetical protein
MIKNRGFRNNSTKRSFVEDEQKITKNRTLRNTIQRLKNRRTRVLKKTEKFDQILSSLE